MSLLMKEFAAGDRGPSFIPRSSSVVSTAACRAHAPASYNLAPNMAASSFDEGLNGRLSLQIYGNVRVEEVGELGTMRAFNKQTLLKHDTSLIG